MSGVRVVNRFDETWVSTSFQGYVSDGVTYQDLVRIFGEGEGPSGDGKVDNEWTLDVDGRRATIYNYKSGPSYHGSGEGTPVEEMTGTFWHIGGNTEEVVDEVNAHIAEHLEATKGAYNDALVADAQGHLSSALSLYLGDHGKVSLTDDQKGLVLLYLEQIKEAIKEKS